MQSWAIFWPKFLDGGTIFNGGPPELLGMAQGKGLSSQLIEKREGPLGILAIVRFGAEITEVKLYEISLGLRDKFLFIETNWSEEQARHL